MKGPIEFEVAGVRYKASRMDIFTQANLARKLAPLIASGAVHLVRFVREAEEIAAAAKTAVTKGGGSPEEAKGAALAFALRKLPPEQAMAVFGPLLAEVAKMPEDDLRFIVATCLGVTSREREPNRWVQVWPPGLAEPMFPEFRDDLILTLRVVASVIWGTIGNFTFGSA